MEVLQNVHHINEKIIPQIKSLRRFRSNTPSVESERNEESYTKEPIDIFLITKQRKKYSLLEDPDQYRTCGSRKRRSYRNNNNSNQNGKGWKKENNKNNDENKNLNNKNNNDEYDDGSDSDNEKKRNFNNEEKENDKKKKKKKEKKNKKDENTDDEREQGKGEGEEEEEIEDKDQHDNTAESWEEEEEKKDKEQHNNAAESWEEEAVNEDENNNLGNVVNFLQDNDEENNNTNVNNVENVENNEENNISDEFVPERDNTCQNSHINTTISEDNSSLTHTSDSNEQQNDKGENLNNTNVLENNGDNNKNEELDEKNSINLNGDINFCIERRNTKAKLDNVLNELRRRSEQNIQFPNNQNNNLPKRLDTCPNNVSNGVSYRLISNSTNSLGYAYIINPCSSDVEQQNKFIIKDSLYTLNGQSQSFGLNRLYNSNNSLYKNTLSTDINKFYSYTSNNEILKNESNSISDASDSIESDVECEGIIGINKFIEEKLDFIAEPLKQIKKWVPINTDGYKNYNCLKALDTVKTYSCNHAKQFLKNYKCIENTQLVIPDNKCTKCVRNIKEHLDCHKFSKKLERIGRKYDKLNDAYKNYINKYVDCVKENYNGNKCTFVKNTNCNQFFFANNWNKLCGNNNCLNKVYSRKKFQNRILKNKVYFTYLNTYYKKRVNAIKKKVERNKQFIHNYCNVCYFDCASNADASNFQRKNSCCEYAELNSFNDKTSLNKTSVELQYLSKINSCNLNKENSNASLTFKTMDDVNLKKKYTFNSQCDSVHSGENDNALKFLKKFFL